MKCIVGASGHGKVICRAIHLNGELVAGIFDHDKNCTEFLDMTVEHDIDQANKKYSEFIIAIGNNKIRKDVVKAINREFFSVQHPKAIVTMPVTIGPGTAIMAGATINGGTVIGKHCIINTSAVVDHDCELEDFVHISPNATLTGMIRVGEGTHIGAGATVIPNIKIGKWVTIGAGTVIIKDVPDYAVVVGNPGKIIKYNDQ